MGGTAKRRRKLLRNHLEKRPDFLVDWVTAESVMLDLRSNPLSCMDNKLKAVATMMYCGVTTIGTARLLSELVMKGIIERRMCHRVGFSRVYEYRRLRNEK
tara:strand:+ start:560 stop:862 length:303 start_codon:yes stop_codon:yes gene_type:complete